MSENLLNINEVRKKLSPNAQLAFMKFLKIDFNWNAPKLNDDFDCFWLGVMYKNAETLWYEKKCTLKEAMEIQNAIFDQYIKYY